MFDLVDVLNNNKKDAPEADSYESVVFYKTDYCKSLICESYRYEGFKEPATVENNEKSIIKFVNTTEVEVIILELTGSEDVVQDTERTIQYLPSHASVVVIGDEDSITTVRTLKSLGIYYLFWPTSKQELIEFIYNVQDNRKRQNGVVSKRRAKRISVVGSKGGVGCSLLAAELAYSISNYKQASTVLVDHNYSGGNLDIMLGKKGLEKRALAPGMLLRALDLSSAQSLLNQVSDKVQLLAMGFGDDSEKTSHDDIRQISDSAVSLISRDVNFVIEDVSASVGFEPKPSWLCSQSDCIILLLEPSVSSLREAGRYVKGINEAIENQTHAVRLIIVVNNPRGSDCDTVSDSEISHFLKHKIDVHMPFEPKGEDIILQGKHLYDNRSKLAKPLKNLTSLILGEDEKKASGIMRFFS